MTISLKHQFQSLKGDTGDNTFVQPSNWNAEHALQLASGKLIGRSSAGVGNAEEIPFTAFGASIINSADLAALAALLSNSFPTTGDAKLTIKTVADAGWVFMDDGTIGDASSGASNRANADCSALFQLMWNTFNNTWCPVSGGVRGVDALTDFNAHRTIALPKVLGRALCIPGTGAGLTARVRGTTLGEESHLLTAAEIPAHDHAVYLKDNQHAHSHKPSMMGQRGSDFGGISSNTAWQSGNPQATNNDLDTNLASSNITIGSVSGTANDNKTASYGGGVAHNIMQPSSFAFNVMIKL